MGEGGAGPKPHPFPVPTPRGWQTPLRTSREVKRARRGRAQLPFCRLSGK